MATEVPTTAAVPATSTPAPPIPMAPIPGSSDWGFMSEWWFIALVAIAIIVLVYYMTKKEDFGAWRRERFVAQYGRTRG